MFLKYSSCTKFNKANDLIWNEIIEFSIDQEKIHLSMEIRGFVNGQEVTIEKDLLFKD